MKNIFFTIIIVLRISFSTSAQNFPVYYFMDSITFEVNTLPFFILPNLNNAFEIGDPDKALFQDAWSQPNALVTGLQNPYPPANWSVFQFRMPTAYYIVPGWPYMATFLAFRHRYDTDTLEDWCRAEVSYDKGLTWNRLTDTAFQDTNQMYTYYCNWTFPFGSWPSTGEVSGGSGEWVLSTYLWRWMIPVKGAVEIPDIVDSLDIRFIFTSDAVQHNRDGWMIDDIITGWADLGGGVYGPEEPVLLLSPNPARDKLRIRLNAFGEALIRISDLQGRFLKTFPSGGENELTIDISNLTPGLYILSLHNRGTAHDTRKFAVIR